VETPRHRGRGCSPVTPKNKPTYGSAICDFSPCNFGDAVPSIRRAVTLTALPPPSLGVSSLDLGRWHASGLFLWCGNIAARRASCGPRRGSTAARAPFGRHAKSIAASEISRLMFLQCGEIFLRCGNARCRRPFVGVSSLDLGHWLASDLFSLPACAQNEAGATGSAVVGSDPCCRLGMRVVCAPWVTRDALIQPPEASLFSGRPV
jgi:hypothetical protein